MDLLALCPKFVGKLCFNKRRSDTVSADKNMNKLVMLDDGSVGWLVASLVGWSDMFFYLFFTNSYDD